MVETLAPDRSDKAFDVRILPWRVRRGEDVGHGHRFSRCAETRKREIPIMEQVPRRRILRKRFAHLLGGPRGGRMRGDRDMYRVPSVMSKHDQHKQ